MAAGDRRSSTQSPGTAVTTAPPRRSAASMRTVSSFKFHDAPPAHTESSEPFFRSRGRPRFFSVSPPSHTHPTPFHHSPYTKLTTVSFVSRNCCSKFLNKRPLLSISQHCFHIRPNESFDVDGWGGQEAFVGIEWSHPLALGFGPQDMRGRPPVSRFHLRGGDTCVSVYRVVSMYRDTS